MLPLMACRGVTSTLKRRTLYTHVYNDWNWVVKAARLDALV